MSCASVPSVVAMMLHQLEVQPGDHILEIGSGTGYNAALLAELTGCDGQVTSIDIDADVALHTRTTLNRAGYERVRVYQRDGLQGAPEHAPYTRMIATVGVWDIPGTCGTGLSTPAQRQDEAAAVGELLPPNRRGGLGPHPDPPRQGQSSAVTPVSSSAFQPVRVVAPGPYRLRSCVRSPAVPGATDVWNRARSSPAARRYAVHCRATRVRHRPQGAMQVDC
ncbi:rRNA adenine N-6-methyltransferase family protein [Streptomyces sp. NPDC048415]|uniref:rRNA adenine N-6-methyltransferase family protein n=1 Tax=Streptomyces sp. NPDC048415 TaxID=3154822 RepID=UPI00344931AE